MKRHECDRQTVLVQSPPVWPGQVLETRLGIVAWAGGAAWPVDVDGDVLAHGLYVALSETEILLPSWSSIICSNARGVYQCSTITGGGKNLPQYSSLFDSLNPRLYSKICEAWGYMYLLKFKQSNLWCRVADYYKRGNSLQHLHLQFPWLPRRVLEEYFIGIRTIYCLATILEENPTIWQAPENVEL